MQVSLLRWGGAYEIKGPDGVFVRISRIRMDNLEEGDAGLEWKEASIQIEHGEWLICFGARPYCWLPFSVPEDDGISLIYELDIENFSIG